ncbi:hypothetical protein OCL06_07535 [Alteromonas sp. ASW11-19]|uniref:Uncharacterized protein n=1 Tax=Alteromonas salexigens TaxID=2982530 RepID=A0ABT2VMA2_9ALTE|nr:hypothetical protein [Alteromonas salexigens]MCU7554446.1 hypothetical protein [Alteromonas salexigens]
MSQAIIAPDENILKLNYPNNEYIKTGSLASDVDWLDAGGNYTTEAFLATIGESENDVDIAFATEKADDAKLRFILPTLAQYLLIGLRETSLEKDALRQRVDKWSAYFRALQHYCYIYSKESVIEACDCLDANQKKFSRVLEASLKLDPNLALFIAECDGFVAASEGGEWLNATYVTLELAQSHHQLLENLEYQANQAIDASKQLEDAVSREKADNELLKLQVEQLQEELEVTFKKLQTETDSTTNKQRKITELEAQLTDNTTQIARLSAELKKLEDLQQAQEAQASQKQPAENKELELLQLQIAQMQEEYERVYKRAEEEKREYLALKTKLIDGTNVSTELTHELTNAMNEQELLQLQIKQLQEELEFYFVEYQKLKSEGGSQQDESLNEYKERIAARFPTLVLTESVTLTGGISREDLQRITVRLTNVEHANNHWDAFSFTVNERNGVLELEFHAPTEKRVYPLSKFIKTGSSKVSDFSILTPFTDAGKKALNSLTNDDKLMLVGLLEEVQAKLEAREVATTEATQQLDLSSWPSKLNTLREALVPLVSTTPAEKPLRFKKLTLKQNMVGPSNEHLLISVEGLRHRVKSFANYEIKIGAKQIKGEDFTNYGSLEFRELANKQAPLATWPPEQEDKWGPKLVLDLPEKLNENQKTAIEKLKEEDREFISELLKQLADRLHTLDLKRLKLNQPLKNWQSLLSNMIDKFS